MNSDFEIIKSILSDLRSDYSKISEIDIIIENAPITERDVVAEIYCRLKMFCGKKELSVHCEIRAVSSEDYTSDQKKGSPIIDVCILTNTDRTWISSAMKIQNNYSKGSFESRYQSIPVNFIHTAIEVKIQSVVNQSKADIFKLKSLYDSNKNCNCFFVLLNARGKRHDHDRIQKYADENGICILEYTCR